MYFIASLTLIPCKLLKFGPKEQKKLIILNIELIMAAGDLAPCITRASESMVLIEFPQQTVWAVSQ